MPPSRLQAAIEALLFSSDQPLPLALLSEALESPADEVAVALRRLGEDYAAREPEQLDMMELEVVSQVASDLAANEAAHLHDFVTHEVEPLEDEAGAAGPALRAGTPAGDAREDSPGSVAPGQLVHATTLGRWHRASSRNGRRGSGLPAERGTSTAAGCHSANSCRSIRA